jgi:hypothetical protein
MNIFCKNLGIIHYGSDFRAQTFSFNRQKDAISSERLALRCLGKIRELSHANRASTNGDAGARISQGKGA